MNKAPNETRTHSSMFAIQACLNLYHLKRPVDHRVNLKENKKLYRYLNRTREQEKKDTIDEGDGDTNPQEPEKEHRVSEAPGKNWNKAVHHYVWTRLTHRYTLILFELTNNF